jgi:hypothetical protein
MAEHLIAQPYFLYSEVIPSDLVDLILKEVNEIPSNEYCLGEVQSSSDHHEYEISEKTRNSKISWWNEEHWTALIFSHYFNKSNRENWEYDLDHLDDIQVSTYNEGDHYTWHCDYGTSTDDRYTRKISASLLVTDPSEYEGGDLELIDYHNNLIVAPKQKGTIVVFDSRVPHRVTPVTKGKRISIVSWMLGPKLR